MNYISTRGTVMPPIHYYTQLFQLAFASNGGKERRIVKCCFHKDNEPSLSINLRTGSFCCFACGAKGGGIIDFHMRLYGVDFKTALRQLASGTHVSQLATLQFAKDEQVPDEDLLKRIQRVWERSRPITANDEAGQYLANRGLHLDHFPDALRFNPKLAYEKSEEGWITYPAMVAKIESTDGTLISLHRTFLHEGAKAPVSKPKKLMRSPTRRGISGAAIQLFTAGEVLGVAEGIETALACHLMADIPVWSTVNAVGMQTFEIPPTVRKLVIFADNDASKAGQVAASCLAERALKQGLLVKLMIPELEGTDWLDFYNIPENHE